MSAKEKQRNQYKILTKDFQNKLLNYFALFPITIGLERRWMELVEIEQEFSMSF